MYPGTEIMRPGSDGLRTHGSRSHGVLIPRPSNEQSDPLNWSNYWKRIVCANQALYVLFPTMASLSIAPLTPVFEAEFQQSENTVSLYTGVTLLVLGFANFLIVPISNLYGRRTAALLTCLVVIASCIWQATARSSGSFFGARVLNGVGVASNETIMVQVIADMFFLHERGYWMGVYFTMYFSGLFIGPIIAGNMAATVGWRSFFWLCMGLACLNFLLLLFLFPETRFNRSQLSGITNTDRDTSLETNLDAQSSREKCTNVAYERVSNGRPSKNQFRLWQRPSGKYSIIVKDIYIPFLLFAFPIVFWAAGTVSSAACVLLVTNLTESRNFAAPPYNFSTSLIGFTNFAMLFGGIIAICTAGPFSDWVAKRATLRNNGIREPEMRLPALIPFFVILILWAVVQGLGYDQKWHWEAIVIFAYVCVGIVCIGIPTIATAYAVDCYKPISGEILVSITIIKNTWGFGLSFWVYKVSLLQDVFIIFAFIAFTTALALPMYFWGKTFRRWTRQSKVHTMERDL